MLLFVYGSLKKGFLNSHVLNSATFIRKTCTKNKYTLINLGEYPALVKKPSYIVRGELYRIDENDKKTLRNLDILEDYPKLYNKETIELSCGEFALVYYIEENIIGKIKFSELKEGDWKETEAIESC